MRLSVVLVVHGEQAHLEEIASSALHGDVELVVVDDASPDHGPELLDALATRDERVRVHHLTERVGLGQARNLGLELARGEYVWFVNTSDVVAPQGVLERLEQTSPDVLLLGDRIEDALGRSRPGPRAGLVKRLNGVVTLDEEPRLADAAPRLWDKVLRREGLGRFAPGRHGELTVTWPALLRAGRIAALPGTSYTRRELENATRVPGAPFDAYDAVLAGADDRTRRIVVPAMGRHLLSLLDRIPEKDRREFFHRASDLYRRHRTGDEPAGTRVKLLERDAYAAYRLLEQGLEARRRAPALKAPRNARARLRKASLERHYRSRLRQPLDPELAVYAAYWFRGYSCNPRAIYERAGELVPDVRGVWVVRKGAIVPSGVEHVVSGTPEYFDLIASAGYLVNNVNFPNHLVKREGSVHVMTHHGTPLKTMGLDLRYAHHASRRHDFAALLERARRWDFSVSSNRHSTLVWERVYPVPFETLEVGYPRNDALANATDEDAQRLRAELGIAPGQTAVLYAPTHREYRAAYEPALDLGRLAAGLGDDHVVLARQHYFYDADPLVRDLHRAGRLLDVASHASVEELCIASDVLLTDYSSIMFDYAVLDRPIVIHAPDWDVYRELRGTYFDLLAEPPGAVARTEDELLDVFASGAVYEADASRAAFRARFAALDDGHAAERVVRRVWLGERDPRAAAGAVHHPMSERQLLLVVGVGRSGTSLLSGMLGQLGFRIPQPEVQADDTNPRGFGEPRWVVDFHTRLLRERRVTVNDARPAAWDATTAAGGMPAVQDELRTWLANELREPGSVLVKDPRTVWFLPLWMRCAEELGARTSFVTMLRHPAEIVTSARRSYGTGLTEASRAAAWINVILQTEHVTRAAPRAFVRYEDLLADWLPEVRRLGAQLDDPALAEIDRRPEVDAFVDPGLHRSRTSWADLDVPDRVRDLAETVWAHLDRPAPETLDADRAAYRSLYAEAEAIAQCSVMAARPRKKRPAPPPSLRTRLARRVRKLRS